MVKRSTRLTDLKDRETFEEELKRRLTELNILLETGERFGLKARLILDQHNRRVLRADVTSSMVVATIPSEDKKR